MCAWEVQSSGSCAAGATAGSAISRERTRGDEKKRGGGIGKGGRETWRNQWGDTCPYREALGTWRKKKKGTEMTGRGTESRTRRQLLRRAVLVLSDQVWEETGMWRHKQSATLLELVISALGPFPDAGPRTQWWCRQNKQPISQSVSVFLLCPPWSHCVPTSKSFVFFSKWHEMSSVCENMIVLVHASMAQWLTIWKHIGLVRASGDLMTFAKSKKNTWYYQCPKV